jgi:predicted nucleic acid-binding protein
MQTVIIDTDVAIDYLRGVPFAQKLIVPLWERNAAFLSVLSIYEIYSNVRKKEQARTEDFINACQVELVTPEIARRAGELRKTYREQGITLTAVDCLINATAVVKGHRIATRNIAHCPSKEILMDIGKGA